MVHPSHLSCLGSQQVSTWDESLPPSISLRPSPAEPRGKLGPAASVQKFSQMRGSVGVSTQP